MKVGFLTQFIARDIHPRSGWVRRASDPTDKSKDDLFIKIPGIQGHFWVQANGSWVSGWNVIGDRFAYRPGLIGRWRLRRAVRKWDREEQSRNEAIEERYDEHD